MKTLNLKYVLLAVLFVVALATVLLMSQSNAFAQGVVRLGPVGNSYSPDWLPIYDYIDILSPVSFGSDSIDVFG